ncbi:MAG: hypothetical protein KF914_09025 [Rhizobiaceae bacterium]|nr:hypothetical protein [Rhizobiaceae bacterium]
MIKGLSFRTYVLAIGAPALLSILFPPLVLFGLFLGILPETTIWLAPSLLLYSILWWPLWLAALGLCRLLGADALKPRVRIVSGIVAAAIIAVPAVAVPRILNGRADDVAARAVARDADAPGKIRIPSVVAVVLAREPGSDGLCETVCQRLLYNEAAERVIVSELPSPASPDRTVKEPLSFHIEHRASCPPPAISRREIGWKSDWNEPGPPVQERVRARIMAGDCLIATPGRIEDAGLVIVYSILRAGPSGQASPWGLGSDRVKIHRLELLTADGGLLFRRTGVETWPLATPLRVESRSSFLSASPQLGWARTKTTASRLELQGRDVLPGLLGDAVRAPEWPEPGGALRTELVRPEAAG